MTDQLQCLLITRSTICQSTTFRQLASYTGHFWLIVSGLVGMGVGRGGESDTHCLKFPGKLQFMVLLTGPQPNFKNKLSI